MKEQDKIPKNKVQRASRFLSTGAKVGGNYLKHYTKKMFHSDLSRDELDKDNANDIYNTLSQLKGSALKVAQMISMERNFWPEAYIEKFAMAQYNAPPLSYPLVQKTFREYFGKSPDELYDSFTRQAVNAASIGQVHQAQLHGKKLAVKVQYPGVADSVQSDLKMVKPFALQLLNIKKDELNYYMDEVEGKLLEETDYELELKRSVALTKACEHLENVVFPEYYPELSCGRIITMTWLEGDLLRNFLKTNPSQEVRNRIGQSIWDFFNYQIHHLREVHADPHPGNFIIHPDGKVGIIDFGCVKVIPEDFYNIYFRFVDKKVFDDEELLMDLLRKLGIITPKDTPREIELFSTMAREMIFLVSRPLHAETFDFSDDSFFKQIYELGESFGHNKEVRKANAARGSRDAIYINRTYFGLYSILNEIGATINTRINL